jgi:adenylate cyclase
MESASREPYLVICRTDGDETIPLPGANSWKLGRGRESSIVLDDELVSRSHAMIQRMESGEFMLIDMGSRNGSFVNEARVSTPTSLRDGDRLTLGNAKMVFYNPLETSRSGVGSQEVDAALTVCHFQQCLVSVLVVDIRGFTVLSQQLDNAEVCRLTGSWFGEADRIIRSRSGAAQKYIGDAVMAIWMHRAKGQEHVEILEILRALAEFADVTKKLGEQFHLPGGLRIGAGLNTGLATVGNTGTNQISDYTATGECVNAAFRLETATKTLQTDFCLGKTTSDFLRFWPRAAAYLKETEVALKGYDSPVRTCPGTFAHLRRFLDTLDGTKW